MKLPEVPKIVSPQGVQWPNKALWWPNSWILPGEFSFGPSGWNETLRIGPTTWKQHKSRPSIRYNLSLIPTISEETIKEIVANFVESREDNPYQQMLNKIIDATLVASNIGEIL